MRDVVARFDDRVQEVEVYFRFLRSAQADGAHLCAPRGATLRREPMGAYLQTILRANAFLILYNLIESTVRESIAAICSSIRSDGLGSHRVHSGVRQLWVNHRYRDLELSRAAHGTYVEIAQTLVDEVVAGTAVDLDGYRIRGNVGGKHIERLAQAWGFTMPGGVRRRDMSTLDTVKDVRNGLAHGLLSFAECGRQYTVPQLERMKHQVIIYLRAVLRNIQSYLRCRRYATA